MWTLTPLRYPGGKSKIYSYIKKLIDMNGSDIYVEPFAGGAGVAIKLLLNGDVNHIVINDYDRAIFAFWYCVVNHSKELIELIKDTPINMEEWYKQKEIQKLSCYTEVDLLKLGFSTLFLNRTNRSGIIKAGVIGGKEQSGNYKMDCRFNKEDIINKINVIARLKNRITVKNKDAIKFINEDIVNYKKSFIFFDPPYYNKGPSLYTNFYTHEDHLKLSESIQKMLESYHWILTYDTSDEILRMYEDYEYLKYNLNYSISKPTQGEEFLFYSKQIKKTEGDASAFIKVIK